jgi:retron-type reverse transcriptase
VHHALMNVLGPVLERGMIFDSYANRAGKGTHAALDRFTHFARRNRYLLHGDIRLYFPSIDHEILKRLLERRVKCGPTLELAARIIDGSNPQVDAVAYFPGDDLFTPHERRRGLPIGNLTSQWLANFYLDGLDHFVQERLRPRGYLRYVDDFVLFADDKRSLHAARDSISRHLEGLRLRLHETKTFVAPARAGCRFLGFVVTPWVRKLRAENVRAFRRRLRAAGWRPGDAMEPDGELGRSVSAWVAHAAHGSTWRLRRRLLGALADGPAAAAS